MKKTIFYFCLITLSFGDTHAQNAVLDWVVNMGGTNFDTGVSTAVDGAGNVYTTGYFQGTADFDPGTGTSFLSSAGNTDIFISKSDVNGNFLWAKRIGGTSDDYGRAIDIDASGNAYVTGYFTGTVDFNPGAGVLNLVSAGGVDVFVLKLDSSGNFVWAKGMGGTSTEIAFSIAVDASGNAITTGSFYGTIDFDPGAGTSNLTPVSQADVFISKLDANGNFVWAKKIGGTASDTGYGVCVDASGNVYTTGEYAYTVDFDPGAGIHDLTSVANNFDVFILKLDANGNFVWVKSMGAGINDTGRSIAVDGSGNVYTTGNFQETGDFDPGAGVSNLIAVGLTDIFISKLDVNGNFVWAKSMGGSLDDSGYSLALDNNGNVYTTGSFMSAVDFNPGAGTYNLTSSGGSDIFISKLDSGGNFIWTKSMGGTLYDYAYSISLSSTGIYTTGSFYATVDFDPDSGTNNLTTVGSADIFVHKLIQVCSSTTSTIVVSDCSSYTVPSGDETHTVSGIYMDTIPNAANCDSVITINLTIGDALAPVANAATLANVTSQCSVASLTAPTAADNCEGTITGTHNATLPITAQGTTVVTWTYADGNGNTSTQTQNVVITDNTAPVATIATLSDVTSQCSVSSLTAPTATDNCAGTITGTHNATLPITAQGTTSVIWTYNDGNGNTSTQTQNIIINDNTAPVANTSTLSDVTSQCSVTSLTAPTVTDNCAGTITGTHNATLPITAQGTTIVTWTYNDGHGNTSTQTQNVVINDNIAPVANTATLSNVTAQCSVTSLTAPIATDNCEGTITGTHNATLPITTQGTTVVTWTYNDGNGNTSTQTQDVIITDNTAPVANTVNLSDLTNQCSVTSLTAPIATDNCAGTVTGTHNATLPITTQGTTVVTWTYNDGHGNTATQTQNVIISDNTVPVPNLANLSTVNGNCSVASIVPPTATDNCVGTITATTTTVFPITTTGTTIVTWTYIDGHGNASTQTQNVVISVPVATTTVSGLTITATTSGATYQWINCGNGNTPVNGATFQSFTPTANGTYAVIVTQNGCSATSGCVTISTVGLDELSQSVFTLYPNPNAGTFTVVTGSEVTITISNASGQLVSWKEIQSGESTIELTDVESGIYFVSATDSNGQVFVQRVSVIK